MRLRALCVLCVLFATGCSGTSTLFRQYEYEEEVYLSLDGSATVYVNSSLAALNALRGTSFDIRPESRVDLAAVRAYYSSPATRVIRVSQSRRSNRRFAHVRLEVDDITKLSDMAPFAWSKYQFTRDGDQLKFLQTVGKAAGKDVGNVGWNGGEIVAFRLHLPSRIRYHNTKRDVGRGNILAWEQMLHERLKSVPVVSDGGAGSLDARMDAQSILYTTLWLFGVTFLIVAVVFCGIIWWVMRKGSAKAAALLFLAVVLRASGATHAAPMTPIIVELFTSEGCEDCPAADTLLDKLAGAGVIALGEHVDYWDRLGWKDRFSSAAWTSRQQIYQSRFNTDSIYTPQMVVDGRAELVGSDANAARKAIDRAMAAPHGTITIDVAGDAVSVSASDLPHAGRGDHAEIIVAVTESGLRTDVKRGENHGRTLSHAPVVRHMAVIGQIAEGSTSGSARAGITLAAGWQRDHLAVVAFVQEVRGRTVLASAVVPLKNARQ